MAPRSVGTPEQTSAPLVLGPRLSERFRIAARVTTDKQLRTGSDPNPWEVAWLVWSYTDDAHFYYFIPKPNGWELGKRDPTYAGGQRFLATGTSPAFEVGDSYDVEVTQEQETITIWVDTVKLTVITDRERPYTNGRVGLYSEDAAVRFTNIHVEEDDRLFAAAGGLVDSPRPDQQGVLGWYQTDRSSSYVPSWNGDKSWPKRP